jgi:predicted RNA-binding Zn ribbon-like protein
MKTVSWDWLGEPLAIDFANTVLREGGEYGELLRSGADVTTWARREAGRVPVPAAGGAATRLAEIRAVRDDVFAVLAATAAGESAPHGPAGRLDARARAHPVVAQLLGESVVCGAGDGVDELLARVVAAAIELARSDVAVGLCDAPGCGQYFVRGRPNQSWCGPACGTRARVARHAARAQQVPRNDPDASQPGEGE